MYYCVVLAINLFHVFFSFSLFIFSADAHFKCGRNSIRSFLETRQGCEGLNTFFGLCSGRAGWEVKRKQVVDSVNMCIILLKHVRHNYELMLVSPHIPYLIVGTLVCE